MIRQSLLSFKAFFSWLYLSVRKLQGEAVDEMIQVTNRFVGYKGYTIVTCLLIRFSQISWLIEAVFIRVQPATHLHFTSDLFDRPLYLLT